MAVAYQSFTQSSSWLDTANCVLGKPTGLAEGDLMIAHIYVYNLTITPPADWTQIDNVLSDSKRQATYWKIASAADAAASNFTFTIASGEYRYGALYRITGHDATTPIGGHIMGANTGGTATVPTFTGFTPPANCLFIMGTIASGNGSSLSGYALETSSPTFTERYDAYVDTTHHFAGAISTVRAESTATGYYTITASNTNGFWLGTLIAIQPTVPPAGPANLKTYNTNLKANIKTINTNPIANVKTLNTNV